MLADRVKTARDRRWITPEPLNVAPALVGQPLASPLRRAVAISVDLGVIGLLSDVSGFWLLGGLALVVLQLRSRRGGGSRGPRWVLGWIGAALVLLLAFQQAQEQWQAWRRSHQAGSVTAQSAESGDVGDGADAAAAASAASAPPLTDAQRIARLEAELAQARHPKPLHWKDKLGQLLDDLGAGLGWGIVYFSLLPAWWGGQTVGKKLFGLRVVELTGKPMTVMRCLKRYGGYAAGVATGGLGFFQVLWDPNRQGIQDKTAHTAVIDLRAPGRAEAAPPADAQSS
ncbi:MAG: RDD family protein [Burkholderiales bacterium]|nr:RDD family protein [Burkholderiales bacterium]